MSQKPSARTQPAAGEGRYLTFSLGDESYGLPVLNVREIIRLCPITPVPRMPPHVKGVINLRGTVIAVLDLRAKFQLHPQGLRRKNLHHRRPSGGSLRRQHADGCSRGCCRRGGATRLRPTSRRLRTSEGRRRRNIFWAWPRSKATSKSCSTSRRFF